MKRLAALFVALAIPAAALATDSALTAAERWEADKTTIFEATEVGIDEFLWLARPVVVFAETARNPDFQRQITLLQARPEELAIRDVVIIVDADPEARSEWRLRLRPRGFMLAVLDKDGRIELRKPVPWDVREISRSIDSMPLRRREIREGR
ncbi:DUF4174 domain-containing protein [Palleronia sp. KMU-117]|uniref:DUF4174 domain-containing protein n=1 Tax=Palleronia sp. KMU-117 TaxID=3434108 RepID=UPI003D75F35A